MSTETETRIGTRTRTGIGIGREKTSTVTSLPINTPLSHIRSIRVIAEDTQVTVLQETDQMAARKTLMKESVVADTTSRPRSPASIIREVGLAQETNHTIESMSCSDRTANLSRVLLHWLAVAASRSGSQVLPCLGRMILLVSLRSELNRRDLTKPNQ